MSGIIYPYRQKPPAGTPFDPNHEQVQGLPAWYLMDEGMGLNVRNLMDTTGDTDGTLTNMANPATPTSGWGAGQFGSALAHDGTNDSIHIADPIVTAYPFSICAWFKIRDNSVNRAIVSISLDSSVNVQAAVQALGAAGGDPVAASVRNGVSFEHALSTSGFSVGTWHHVCGVFTSATLREVYLDAGSRGQNTVSRTLGAYNAMDIGVLGDSTPGNFFNGVIDDVRIYNRALEQPLIEQIAFDGLAMFKQRVFFVAPAVGVLSPYYYTTLLQGGRV